MGNYDEVSFREIIIIILKGSKTLVFTTLLSLIFAFSLLKYGNPETYTLYSQTKVSYLPSYATQYGLFDSEIEEVQDIINIIQDDYYELLTHVTTYQFPVEHLNPYLSFEIKTQDVISIKYSGLDLLSLQNLQSNVFHTLNQYLSTKLQDEARDYFIVKLNNESFIDALNIQKNNELIKIFETQLTTTNKFLENSSISPAYESIVSILQGLKNENTILEYSVQLINKQLKDLQTLSYEQTLPSIGIHAEMTHDEHILTTQRYKTIPLITICLSIGLLLGMFINLLVYYFKNIH